jgi:hypothetical protein
MLTEADLPGSRQLRQSPHVVSSRLGDAGVLVHLRTNKIFELNATGLRIWELLGEGESLENVERRLCDEFNAEPTRLRSELVALLNALHHEGLVE